MRRADNFEFSIRGDEQEHHRIMLENNLQHTDLSLHLSSTPDDDDHSTGDYSIEYPRHYSGPTRGDGYVSFDYRSRDDFEPSSHSLGAWSYPTADDDEGVNPYGGETISTAAHHASALTLSAGLPGRAARREASVSGGEYDPDRPIQDMIAALDSKMSMFDMDPSRSRNTTSAFEPLVVDDTADLANVSTGTPRPKLADHLSRLAFSPKRPRSALSPSPESSSPRARPHKSHYSPISERHRNIPSPLYEDRTPRPAIKSRTSKPSPAVRSATPSTTNSQFTKLARGLAKEIEGSRRDGLGHDVSIHFPNVSAHSTIHERRSKKTNLAERTDRNPLRDMANVAHVDVKPAPRADPVAAFRFPAPANANSSRSALHLPDVTGLTSAVASPAKPGLQYYGYRADEEAAAEAEARLIAILNTLQSKLGRLEDENGVSRRRVRELELELEACKKEAARERTVLMDDSFRQRQGKNKTKQPAAGPSRLPEDNEKRYREIIEEKKALEALISTLRTHLTRLTSELSSHQKLLVELRSLRETDSRTLKEKADEVDRLREEVERLAGEVEVLRGVVEEGLKERRSVKISNVHNSLSYVTEERTEDVEREGEEYGDEEGEIEEEEEEEVEVADEDIDEEDEPEVEESQAASEFDYPSTVHQHDRTVVTDRATLGSSGALDVSTRRIVRVQDVDGITTEDLDSPRYERTASPISLSGSRSRSNASHSQSLSRSRSATPGPSQSLSSRDASPHSAGDRSRDSGIGEELTSAGSGGRQQSYSPISMNVEDSVRIPGPSRPAAPTPGHAAARRPLRTSSSGRGSPVNSTPFPAIRGEHLEKLFFSAPEHNAKTCPVCNRRRRPGSPTLRFRPHSRTRVAHQNHDDDDEGFADGMDDVEDEILDARTRHERRQQKQRSKEGVVRQDLPPQTVLARVIKELEDDFTHYKGIYVELADQYKLMDAMSDIAKRNVLADHLRDVIDILEQKGDQIASLYGLLNFKDKPLASDLTAGDSRPRKRHPTLA